MNAAPRCSSFATPSDEVVGVLRASAEAGDAAAEERLARLLEEGQLVTQDRREAERWYRRAARSGSSQAQAWLARAKDAETA